MADESEDQFFERWTRETLAINGVDLSVPSLLFKFVACNSKYFQYSALELLLHNRIRLSKSDEFNDPFDCSLRLETATREEAREFLKEVFADQGLDFHEDELSQRFIDPESFRASTQESMRSTLAASGICSFSSSVTHPLMWAHYSCSHQGLAYVFRQGFDSDFGAMPVRYQNSGPTVALSNRHEIPLASLIKGKDWRYEREWRIVETKQGGNWKALGPAALYGVVFGARCAESDKDFLLELVRRRAGAGLPPIRLYEARINDAEFKLDFFQLVKDGWKQVELP